MFKNTSQMVVLFLACCLVGYSLISCEFLPKRSLPSGAASPTSSIGFEPSQLAETAQVLLSTEVAAQLATEEQALAATQTALESELSFDEKVQTAAASTQIAQETQLAFVQAVQTAVAQTQIAKTPTLSLEQQVQVVLAQTQNSLVQTQTAYSLTQAAFPKTVQPSGQNVANDPLFNGAYVYRYGFLQNNRYLVTMQLTNPVTGTYYAVIGGKTFKCSVIADYPNRLYCTGPSVKGGKQTVLMYRTDDNRLVYTGEVILPQWTPTWVPPWRNCCVDYDPYTCYCTSCNGTYPCYPCYPCVYATSVYYKKVYPYYCIGCRFYDENGKCYYYDSNGRCRYCKTGNLCR